MKGSRQDGRKGKEKLKKRIREKFTSLTSAELIAVYLGAALSCRGASYTSATHTTNGQIMKVGHIFHRSARTEKGTQELLFESP